MLYVFHVDAGLMTTYDMSLTLQSVMVLKQAIEKKTKTPASSLVLLVSGGEVLQSDHMVSSYSAGTDTNPIYMFSKPTVKDGNFKQSHQYSVCDLSPIVELSSGTDWRSELRSGVEVKSVAELKSAVDMCCSLPPAVNTIVTCANLAQQFSEFAREFSRSCERLVHDQHLQHQGWAAVVANLEDIFNEFCERSKNFKESFKKHRLKKDDYHNQLNSLNEVLESLGKIPILPALQLNAEAHRFSAFDVFEETDFEGQYDQISAPLDNSSEHKGYPDFGVEAFKLSEEEEVFEEQGKQWTENKTTAARSHIETCRTEFQDSDEGVSFKAHSLENKENLTLLHWILAQGNKASLQDILDYCQKGLVLIDEDPLKEREAELCSILEYANMHGLKQIKGIEDRLYGLDQLFNEVKKLERDQHDQAASLIQNRERVSTACDPSVLPTLVQSHRCQLEKLLKNHETMVDIRRRIAKSKDELSHILKARLEAVLMIENSMSVQDAHQMLSFQCFNRLARYFDIVEQLHRAPRMFVHAVHEVARRRTFSNAFLQWATDLANHLLKIHNEEVLRRQEFNSIFHGHFLKSLFPGTGELPPVFATQAPAIFDASLPKLTEIDVEFISSSFSDMMEGVPKYDMEYVVNFFKQRFGIIERSDKAMEVQTDLDKGFESETDTCEFEKLCRENTQGIDMSTTCAPDTAAVSTITEENMDAHKINIEKLKDFLMRLYELCKINILLIREQLSSLRSDIDEQNKFFSMKYIEILKAWEVSNEETAIRFREETQRLTVDHELELSDMKKVISNKDEEIATLKKENEDLKYHHVDEMTNLEIEYHSTKQTLETTKELIQTLECRIEEAEAIKQKEMKDLQDKLHMDYKAEIESLRSRFRLVALTNMDRSPSESSLEKIERTDVIEIANHNAIMMQTKENAEEEKEQAVKEAIDKCEMEWQQKLAEEINSLKSKFEIEKQVAVNDAARRIIDEKDRQLEQLRERENNLARECAKYKETIQQLADSDSNDGEDNLKQLEAQVATLESEKATLSQQVQDLKKEMETRNEEGDRSKEDDTEISATQRRDDRVRRGRCHTPWGLPGGTLSLSSCLPGHAVLVMWDPSHRNYTVMQESSMMYFVYSECLAALDLSINVRHESERRLYAVAVVESKEYCFAKKSGNRYMMPRGSRFYRVHVRPYRTHVPPPCCEPRHSRPTKEDKQPAVRPVECMKRTTLFNEPRLVKKWLNFMHAPDMQRSVETIMSASAVNEETAKVEVATATLINLESPVGPRPEGKSPPVGSSQSEDQLDSIEADAQFGRVPFGQLSASTLTDMEGSVGRLFGPEPLVLPTELTVSAISAVPRDGSVPPDSELAEEAKP